MCGIVGYVGRTMDGTALDVVMEGLTRLEYRGYDSASVAVVTEPGADPDTLGCLGESGVEIITTSEEPA